MSGRVKSFYERNTRLFIAFGGGRRSGAIHREVWGEGVATREEAFVHVNELISRRILAMVGDAPVDPFRIIDLGCGVGGSLTYLLDSLPFVVEGVGVTISPAQMNIANQRAALRTTSNSSATFVTADFNQLPDLEPFDVAFAIESFIHGQTPGLFFQEAARVLNERGRLFVIDDFLTGNVDNKWIRQFKRGWLTGSLLQIDQVEAYAERAGFTCFESVDLTPYLRLGRVRDRVIRQVMKMPAVQRMDSAYMRGLSGGDALQKCLQEGWIKYRLIGFEKKN